MTYERRFSVSLAGLFLLSAIVFALNVTPSTIAIDDTDSQISPTESAGQRLPTLFIFVLVATAGILLLRVLRGEPATIPAPEHDREALLLRIARGPPVPAAAIIYRN